eukprot:m.288906 g.288906  ORF g.288906 m.288906 type:complete len:635 (+) comp40709_c0_seq2:427-2331(+)
MSQVQAESVIKSIIREIAQECAGQGHAVSETLVAFMVKAVVMDPDNGFSTERSLSKNDVERIIEKCAAKLMDTEWPSIETIKMQVYFDMNYTSREEFLDEHKRVLESRLQPVVRDITDSRARTREDLDALYRKMVSCVLLRSGLGSPTDISVVKEATGALQSVLPDIDFGNFLQKTKLEKERHLKELTQFVTGIRLFNRSDGKGGRGIDDLPAILREAIPATEQSIKADLNATSELVCKYLAIIENALDNGYKDPIPLEFLKQAQVNCRQHQVYLRILEADVLVAGKRFEALEKQYHRYLSSLKETIQSKATVPVSRVYPSFVALSECWTGFQDETVLLSVLSNISSNLGPFTHIHREKMKEDVLEPLLNNVVIQTDKDRVSESQERVDWTKFKKLEWHFPESTKDFEYLPFEYKGFCSYTMASCDRLLLPSNPNVGVLRYKERFYTFSSKEAAEKFASNPPLFIAGIGELAKASPDLIHLLDLHSFFVSLASSGPGSQSVPMQKLIQKPVTRCDAGVQTEVHPLEVNLVKSYEWNEWELRRKAIKLANLRSKMTHSTQTDSSHYRQHVSTQVYLPKDSEIQTKRVKHTSVPEPSRYLAGLRGGPPGKTKMMDVDLTLSVETHNVADDYGPKNH